MKKKSTYKYGSTEWYRCCNLRKLYKISLIEWELLFDAQGRKCALCGTTNKHGKNWHTDHDHKTKRIRGILCGWCNTGIGKLQESPALLVKSIEYITRHRDKGGKQDILKAIHYLQLLLEEEYSKQE